MGGRLTCSEQPETKRATATHLGIAPRRDTTRLLWSSSLAAWVTAHDVGRAYVGLPWPEEPREAANPAPVENQV